MDFEALAEGDHKLSLNISLNIMIPKDVEDRECVVVIKINFLSEDSTSVLSASIRGYVDVDTALSEEEKGRIIRANAVPSFYEILRNFVGDTTERANVDFPNIPPAGEVDF